MVETYQQVEKERDKLRKELAALKEAVAWERECEMVMGSLWFYYEGKCPYKEARVSVEAARAEVDRLLSEEKK